MYIINSTFMFSQDIQNNKDEQDKHLAVLVRALVT